MTDTCSQAGTTTPLSVRALRAVVARPALVADLFCGAGGSSTGAHRAMDALGLRMVLTCVNHWPLAIETHQLNHPEARHYCQDIASLRPVEAVPEGYLDLLMASPTCTHHSRARGGKPTSDQQRQDPWHVVTWLTELRVKRLLVENVPEFVEWGPVHVRTGKPVRSRKGEYFLAWVGVLRGLGFRVEWRLLNAADYGDATTRQRFFLIARSDGKSIRWPEPTHCRGGASTMFGALKPWRAAREVIDWTIEGRSIFDRKKPLAPKTIARILAGAQKFRWPEPFLVILRNNATAASINGPLRTISAGGGHHGLAQQVAVPFVLSQGAGGAAREVVNPLPTIVGSGAISMVEPMLVTATGGEKPKAPRSVGDPLGTITTKNGVGIAEPMLSPYYGASASCVSVDSPVPTVTTKARFGVVEPVAEPVVTPAEAEALRRAADQGRLVSIDGALQVLDIRFRMLEPSELARASGFSDQEAEYEFAGNKTDITRQIGNAVPVNMARALVTALFSEAAT